MIAPDADPGARDAMLQVLQRYFAIQRELAAVQVQDARTEGRPGRHIARVWQLHVWTLTGAPDDWERQLAEFQARQPVFAVISGIGRGEWAPVHAFCQSRRVPCLFPNIDVPVVAEQDFYPVYFSRGVLLEADLFAARLRHYAGGRIVQVYRRGDAGAAGAARLRLAGLGAEFIDRSLPPVDADLTPAATLESALAGLDAGDTLLLWLRPADLRLLGAPPSGRVLASGLMGGLEDAPLPAAWRDHAEFSYAVDLPERREVRQRLARSWLQTHGLPPTFPRLQTDTWTACRILAGILDHVGDAYVPEFLLERLEMMLGRRLPEGYYARLGLAPGQRFASKGGYLVRLGVGDEPSVTAVTDWTVP
ncbi:MAG: hypothetical protein NTZ79_10835 [Proteobacteria bacterium]|nr:hypothetical protein [Pseudomonadota bacterium]